MNFVIILPLYYFQFRQFNNVNEDQPFIFFLNALVPIQISSKQPTFSLSSRVFEVFKIGKPTSGVVVPKLNNPFRPLPTDGILSALVPEVLLSI